MWYCWLCCCWRGCGSGARLTVLHSPRLQDKNGHLQRGGHWPAHHQVHVISCEWWHRLSRLDLQLTIKFVCDGVPQQPMVAIEHPPGWQGGLLSELLQHRCSCTFAVVLAEEDPLKPVFLVPASCRAELLLYLHRPDLHPILNVRQLQDGRQHFCGSCWC